MNTRLRPLVYRIFVQYTQASGPSKTFPNLNDPVPSFIDLNEICGFAKYLAIDSDRHSFERVSEIIQMCRNVEDLACWGGLDLHELWPFLSQNTVLRMLSGMVDGLTHEHFRSDTFFHITHFEVLYPSSSWDFSSLSILPSLTHLSIYRDLEYDPDDSYYQQIAGVLPKCPRLRVYVECLSKAQTKRVSDDALQLYATDPRMVVFDFSMSNIDDWLRGARGGIDAWWHAENIAFARKRQYDLFILSYN
ncbi:hypothetical protein BJ165DRAFT_1007186 [Panaeolus papilionaceus]|nr:hypothetical protein BJ165DRAFT_1007186 [Panaeolus papilionaceus]